MLFLRTLCFSAAFLAAFTAVLRANDVITNIVSPVASYQYPEDLGGAVSTYGGIISPVASYQYFEWPGNDVLKLQGSAVVSYFYNLGASSPNISLSGRVTDALGNPQNGAMVSVSVFQEAQASAQTAPDGSYATQPLSPGIYLFAATKAGCVPDQRVVSLNPGTAIQNFTLTPMPPPLQTQVVDSTPPFLKPDLQGAKLRAFDPGSLTFMDVVGSLDSTKITIVLTHGWIPGVSGSDQTANGWPLLMAQALKQAGVTAQANIVAWDWHDAATTPWPPPWNRTPDQGAALGRALYQALGPAYSKQVHFIGHSLGTMVNAEAANVLTDNPSGLEPRKNPAWLPRNIHFTLLDEAEIAINANGFLLTAISSGFSSGPSANSLEPNFCRPIPNLWQSYAWIDNYISAFGLYREEAVNVYLSEAQNAFNRLWPVESANAMHGYAISWYSATVLNASDSLMGFTNSFERAALWLGTPFPPTDASYQSGSGFEQDPSSSDWLAVVPVESSDFSSWNAPFLPLAAPSGNLSARTATLGFGVLNLGLDFIKTVGTASTAWIAQQKVSVEDAFNYLTSQVSQNAQQAMDLLTDANLQLLLTTATALPLTKSAGQPSDPTPKPQDNTPTTNTPACIWLPVMVPVDAAELTFDFSVTGNGTNDFIVFGVNNTNLFSLPLMYLASAQTYASGPIEISTWAGTSNQFFFAILGGTSTNASVRVNNIRFVSFTPPSLSIRQTGGVTILSWSSAANGFILESTASLTTTNWTTVTNAPSLFNGQFSVTNSWPEQNRFFRLRQRN